jgi:thioredoxin reductase (NADPH)
MTKNSHRDVIIVGAGPAGMSAALVLARAQASVLVIEAGEPRNAAATHIQGFLTRDGMPPTEFAAAGRREVTAAGGEILSARVGDIAPRDDAFVVSLADGTIEVARALLIATGLRDDLPDILGASERWGTSVHHCPYCHGYEVRNREIAVIGGLAREMSIKQAGLLRRYSDRVTFVTNGIELSPGERGRLRAFGIRVTDGLVSGLVGDPGALDGITLTDGRTVECEAVFIAPRLRPTDGLLTSLGCEADPATGLVTVDAFGQTSVPGVWAAGNVVNPSAQVITAAGAGSASAIAINGWLLQIDIEAAFAARC